MIPFMCLNYIYLPFVGSLLILLCPRKEKSKNFILFIGLIITVSIYGAFLDLLWFFTKNCTSSFYILYHFKFCNDIYHGTVQPVSLGIDGISLFFFFLTTFIFPMCIFASINLIRRLNITQVKFYMINILFLEFFLLNAFATINLLWFYIFFEAVLIPMMFIIGIWGPSSRRIKANYYFLFYTITGSALLLFAILVILIDYGSLNYINLFEPELGFQLSVKLQLFLWVFFFLSFAVKIPMFPFHIWLPEAHVEAPTVGSVVLAALLLKLGAYGFIRFLPLFPYAYTYYTPLVFTLACTSIVYASMSAIRQVDLKKIIAYSSIAHMNLAVVGIFSLTHQGLIGSIFILISHGFVSAALFFLVGSLYNLYGTKFVKYYSGLVVKMPQFATLFFFFALSNIAFPGTSNFIGEMLLLIGIMERNFAILFLAALGMLFSVIYTIWVFNRVMFGNPKLVFIKNYADVYIIEVISIYFPLGINVITFGLCPNLILDWSYFSIKVLSTYCY